MTTNSPAPVEPGADKAAEELLKAHAQAVIAAHEHGEAGGFYRDLLAAQDAIRAAVAPAQPTLTPAALYARQDDLDKLTPIRGAIVSPVLGGGYDIPLFLATPAAPSERKPLTNDEIRAIFLANGFTVKEGLSDLKPYVYLAARAIEQHHGITEGSTPTAPKCDFCRAKLGEIHKHECVYIGQVLQGSQDQVECNSALRAEPAARVFSAIADLTDEKIAEICVRVRPAHFTDKDGDVDYLRYDAAIVRAVATELATRCRAEGGVTCDKSTDLATVASADAARLDWLEQMGNEPEGIYLHDGANFTGIRGLSLRRIGRSLREAIDQARPDTAAIRALQEGVK